MTHSPFMQLLEILNLEIFLNTFPFESVTQNPWGKCDPNFTFSWEIWPNLLFFSLNNLSRKMCQVAQRKHFKSLFFTNGFPRKTYKEKSIQKHRMGKKMVVWRKFWTWNLPIEKVVLNHYITNLYLKKCESNNDYWVYELIC